MLRSVAFALLVLVGLAGCADDPPAGVQVEILTGAADGPVQGTLMIKSADDGVGTEYELRRVGSDDSSLYVAAGARPGRYRVLSDTGWGMLWTGTTGTAAPLLRDAPHPVTIVRMGKPRTLYVAAVDPSLPSGAVSDRWGAEWKRLAAGDAEPFRPADIEVEDQGEGIMAVRFSATQWKRGTSLRLVGRMQDDSVTKLLSYTIRDADLFELPRLVLVHTAPQASLDVRLVAPPGIERVADGVPVRVTLAGVPLEASYEETTYEGVARFETLAALGHGLRVEVGGGAAPWTYALDETTWRLRRAIHIVSLPPKGALRVPLDYAVADVREVRVRYGTVGDFGLVPFFAKDERIEIVTHPGWQDVLVGLTDGSWVHEVRQASEPFASRRSWAVRADAKRRCSARGTARGAGALGRVRFTLLLPEARNPTQPDKILLPARRAAGEGFEAALSGDGVYETELPPGRYEIQIFAAGVPRGRPRTLQLNPNAVVRVNLQTR